MSYSKRDGKNSNSAIVVSVGEKEFDMNHPLAAIEYQRKLERLAYELGQGKIPQQLFGDFLSRKASKGFGGFDSAHKGNTTFADLNKYNELMEFYEKFSIVRNEDFMSDVKGLYPCGEGAGYAGGITSAAMDGLKVAEQIASFYI